MTNMWVIYISIVLVSCYVSAICCGEHPDGVSSVSREQDALGHYSFSYSVANNEGEQFRKEGTDELGRVIGSYGLKHFDGTHRVVDYVADKNGFRAAVRSNEPGVISAEPADSPILKTSGEDIPLTVAATSNDNSRAVFGKRLHSEVPKVTYVSPVADVEKIPDETVRESRQHDIDDYRPLSPVAYYPGGDVRSPLGPPQISPIRRPADPPRSLRVLQQTPEADSKPLDVYFPPIDPHSARRPPYYPTRDRDSDRNSYPTTTSRRPFIPPYGGFDDDPLPNHRRPEVSMSTIHGGFGGFKKDFPTSEPTLLNRFPPTSHSPNQRDFGRPRFPPTSNLPSALPRPSSGILPSFPRSNPPQSVLFDPPSYDDGMGSPNFVLRGVPIPNGIQAVRVDPTSGRVYERLMYPLFLRHDGYPTYDRNILLHNDDLEDDDVSRNFDNSGNFDIPFPGSLFRGTRNPPLSSDDDHPSRSRRYNGSHPIDKTTMSLPTSSDMAWIHRQLSQVEGFERDGFDNRILTNSHHRDPSFRIEEDHPPFRSSRQSSRLRSFPHEADFEHSAGEGFSRNPRNSEELSIEDSKNHPVKISEIVSHSKQIETEDKSSAIEKE